MSGYFFSQLFQPLPLLWLNGMTVDIVKTQGEGMMSQLGDATATALHATTCQRIKNALRPVAGSLLVEIGLE